MQGDHRMHDLESRLVKSFDLVAFAVNRHILSHMARVSRDLGMDLETAFVWGALAQFNVAHLAGPGSLPGSVPDKATVGNSPFKGARLTDLTQIIGLPRETIRRKLVILQGAGKVERRSDGSWVIRHDGVDAHTREFTKETVRQFLQTANHIESILRAVKL